MGYVSFREGNSMNSWKMKFPFRGPAYFQGGYLKVKNDQNRWLADTLKGRLVKAPYKTNM